MVMELLTSPIWNQFGYLSLTAAFAVSLCGCWMPYLGARWNHENLVRAARTATWLNLVLVLVAGLMLWRALLLNDFSVRFVWEHSSRDLPIFYKLTAFWGGMEGSLLFWELVLAMFAAIAAWLYQQYHREIYPWILVCLNAIQVFLLLLLVTWSNPLALQHPIPLDGRGLNPLLQHPAMAIHPPMLYLGYIGFSVPFAFAIASLISGKLDNAWVNSTRRWTLGAWFALTSGQMLGGQWAYEELGWGGYWGWDPVENAALMPWLTSTAFLHSVILQQRRNMMKVWNIVLIILTFALSILGTFIVRSGILNSVHAFAESDIGPVFLAFLAMVLLGGFGLMFWRIHMLESRHTADRLLSRESAFLLNNLLLMGITFTVLLGTVFPLLAEALVGVKMSIQAPFFNTVIAPLGMGLLLLIGLGHLLAWQRSSGDLLLRNLRAPVLVAAITAIISLLLGIRSAGALVVFALAGFTASVLMLDYFKTVRVHARQQSLPPLRAMYHTIRRNRQRWGGALVHLGVVCLFIGIAGNYFKHEFFFTLHPGQTVEAGRYQIEFRGLGEEQVKNARLRYAELNLFRNGQYLTTLKPARSFYPTQPEPLTEVAIHRTLKEDVYTVLASENTDGSITLRMLLNPLVLVAWLAYPLFGFGTLLAMLHAPRSLPASIPQPLALAANRP